MLQAELSIWTGRAIALMWGAIWGSFANVCVHRLPRGGSLAWPGSHCPSCGEDIRWYDNLPMLSYALLRGRCRICETRISPRYPALEALSAIVAVLIWERYPFQWQFLLVYFFVLSLIVMSVIDLELKIIPDKITYPGIPACVLASLAFPDPRWWESLIGAAAGYLGVRILADGYYFITKREGMGYGDGKLLAMVGGFLGWKALPVTMFLGSVQGLLVNLPLLLWARSQGKIHSVRRHELPFGPFLALGAVEYLIAAPYLERLWPILMRGH